MRISDLGLMAEAVYDRVGTVTGSPVLSRHIAQGRWDGFQAAAFGVGSRVVVAFRGTSVGGDAVSDLALGAGMNSAYFAQGEEFVRALHATDVMVCGHSLGGAIAQVVANRMRVPMVTFNAPGVAVIASRNVGTASLLGSGVRMAGMAASAIVSPGQALRDMQSAFYTVKGLNICLEYDVVSQIGIHYGAIQRIPGTSTNPLTEHRMTTVNKVLATHPLGSSEATF